MATSAIGSPTATGSSSVGNRMSDLTSEDFMKVLIAGFQQQDPLKPQDSDKIVEQLASLRTIESQATLQSSLKSLVSQNQIAAAGNLIGKLVAGLDSTNNQVTGVVTSVLVQADKVVLELDSGEELTMDRVTGITNPTGSGS